LPLPGVNKAENAMRAAKLYGARDFRIENVPDPDAPGPGEALVKIGTVGVCGSDLHTYADGRIGDTVVADPLVLGHEFAGTIAAVGPDALDGLHQPLQVGQRVAVDPALPCWHCDLCEAGHPNLCRNLGFMGLAPDDGALQDFRLCPSRNCFPLPDVLSLHEGALLEPLGVALHAVDLSKVKLEQRVAVLGCGPIGLLIMKLAKRAGAGPLVALDQFDWRLEVAKRFGADAVINIKDGDAITALRDLTQGRGAEIVFEAAWAGDAVAQAVEMADLGARVVLAGIPGDDRAHFRHSPARRKGLTLKMVRRMKHTYPRTIALASARAVVLDDLITHCFPLEEVDAAYALNTAYRDGVIKVMIDLEP
jgi:L-iditol 2-dehydrogenase